MSIGGCGGGAFGGSEGGGSNCLVAAAGTAVGAGPGAAAAAGWRLAARVRWGETAVWLRGGVWRCGAALAAGGARWPWRGECQYNLPRYDGLLRHWTSCEDLLARYAGLQQSNVPPYVPFEREDNEQRNGNYCIIVGLYRDNGKEHGNYYCVLGYIGKMESTWYPV